MMNAISFKHVKCGQPLLVNAIWRNRDGLFLLQAICETCKEEVDYSVDDLEQSILEELGKNYVEGPKGVQ